MKSCRTIPLTPHLSTLPQIFADWYRKKPKIASEKKQNFLSPKNTYGDDFHKLYLTNLLKTHKRAAIINFNFYKI